MGKWIKIIKRFLVDSVFERIREYVHQVVWPVIAGVTMEHYNPSLTTVVLVSILFITICIKLWYKPKTTEDDKPGNWISWDLATRIIRDHPVCRERVQNRPRRYGSSDLDVRIETEADRYSYEMATAKGILSAIVKKYPHAKQGKKKWTHDQYLENVIEDTLNEMMLKDDDG